MGGRGCVGWSGVKGEKWDKCNSIINKIHLKKTKQKRSINGKYKIDRGRLRIV